MTNLKSETDSDVFQFKDFSKVAANFNRTEAELLTQFHRRKVFDHYDLVLKRKCHNEVTRVTRGIFHETTVESKFPPWIISLKVN